MFYGALNFGHSDPPIRMCKIWLNDVPAYGGLAAVDTYIGVTELSRPKNGMGVPMLGSGGWQESKAGSKILWN